MPKKIQHPYTDYDKWFDEYEPVTNHIDNNASWNGCLFETFGEEDEYIRKMCEKNENYVWTILDDGSRYGCVVNGWHYVNRMGYMITKKPWKDGDDFNIYDADDIKTILRRESRERTAAKKRRALRSEFYWTLDTYKAVAIAEGFYEKMDELDDDAPLDAWQYIYDNDLSKGLQGWFGRNVQHLLDAGSLKPRI